MKYLITALCFLGITAFANAQCDINSMTDSCKHHLKPFLYDAINAQHVTLKSVPQEKEVNIPAFSGQHYRIIINISAMPKGTQVGVYDQDGTKKKRKELYTYTDNGQLGVCDLQSHTGRLFIDFTIPAAAPTLPPSGCSVITVGYENGN
jgi:hypothetical protein